MKFSKGTSEGRFRRLKDAVGIGVASLGPRVCRGDREDWRGCRRRGVIAGVIVGGGGGGGAWRLSGTGGSNSGIMVAFSTIAPEAR